jgi:predicted RND superfamily exporter protein
LATLLLSPLPIVRDLGGTLAVGVLIAAGLGLLSRRWLMAGRGAPTATEELEAANDAGAGSPRHAPVALALVLAIVAAAFGWARVTHLPVESDVAYFAGGLPALQDAEHVEDVMGSSGEIDLLVDGAVTSPGALGWQANAKREIAVGHGETFRDAASLSSLLSFLGEHPTQSQIEAGLRLFPAYLTSSVLNADRTKALSSFGVRLDDLPRLGSEVDRINRELTAPPEGVDAQLVGLPLVLVRAQALVSSDRLAGSLWGIAGAVVVLLIGLRRKGDALRAAAAAFISTGLTFATISVAGWSLDPVTASLGALTAAVGCEFTIVYADAVRRGSRRLRSTVVLVAATSTAGYLVLVASGMTAVRGLGLLLSVAVLQALLAATLVVAATVKGGAVASTRVPTTDREVVHV